MRRLLLALAFVALAAGAEARRFTSPRCACSFDVPPRWEVVKTGKCSFGLRPRNWTKIDRGEDKREFPDYAIEIDVERKPFRKATRQAFFQRVDEYRKDIEDPDAEPQRRATDYILRGRQEGKHDAHWIRGDGWFGLIGESYVGYFAPGEGYQGMDSAFRAVLSTGKWRTAIIMADNPFTGAEHERVVKSFKFD